MQFVVELLEFKGKVVPEFLSIRKSFSRRKEKKMDKWMTLVNERVKVYDESIVGVTKTLSEVTTALNANTSLTEEMFVQQSRDRIIDFSYRASDYSLPVSREEYHRIFKVYDKYEKFLNERGMTNGEIDIVYGVVKESYEERMKNHLFTEDIRGH